MIQILLCFAITAADPDTAKETAKDAANSPYWGMRVVPMNAATLAVYDKWLGKACPIRIGAAIVHVDEKGPASSAEIKAMDVIIAVNGKALGKSEDLEKTFAASRPGQKMVLEIRRLESAATGSLVGRPGSQKPAVRIIVNRVKCTLLVDSMAHRRPDAPEGEDPVKIVSAVITHNSINEPVRALRVLGRQDVEAYEIEADAFDKFGGAVKDWGFGGNAHSVMCQDAIEKGKERSSLWVLHGSDGVGVLKCKILRVKLADGTVWKPDENKQSVFEANLEAH